MGDAVAQSSMPAVLPAPVRAPEPSSGVERAPRIEPKWLVVGRTTFALVVVVCLTVLGVANIGLRARWHEVEDGVLWGARAEGVTALDVAAGSPAVAAGIQRGDVLLAVDGSPVES